jgi:uncharacterized protein YeeX (DUF496 family)
MSISTLSELLYEGFHRLISKNKFQWNVQHFESYLNYKFHEIKHIFMFKNLKEYIDIKCNTSDISYVFVVCRTSYAPFILFYI